MGEVIRLESDSPHSWTVEEALERAVEKAKEEEFDCVYVALCKNSVSAHRGDISYTLSGMDLPTAIGWLSMHIHSLMAESMDGED